MSTRPTSRASAYGAAAAEAKAKRRRRFLWLLVVIWASDWIFGWTARLGFEELGAWLWLIGLFVFVYRSVVDTKLPEWLLTWAWMLGVLGLWAAEVVVIHDFVRDPEVMASDPELRELLAGRDSWMAMVTVVMKTALAMTMLGWIMGVVEVVIGSIGLGLAFRSRRRAAADGPEAPPALTDEERKAHVALVVLQFPVFALVIAAAVAAMSAGIVLWRGAADLPAYEAEMFLELGRAFTLGGFAAFVLGVMQLRQLLGLRWCGRIRLVVAAIVPNLVLAGVIMVAVVGGPVLWIFAVVALLWSLTQVSAVRVLWGVRRRLAR